MKRSRWLLFIFLLWVGCSKLEIQPNQTKIRLNPVQNIKIPPQNFGQEKGIYVPISYYAPIKDNTSSSIRLLVPLIYDPDFGVVQATTLNIYNCDSLELDGNDLTLYSQSGSQVVSYPPDAGQFAPYQDSTVVMVVYRDSTMNIIPNARYESGTLQIPQKKIMGFWFLMKDYYTSILEVK